MTTKTRESDLNDWPVTVCDKCRTAACWQQVVMCDEAQKAGTVAVMRSALYVEGREHWEFWEKEAPPGRDSAGE